VRHNLIHQTSQHHFYTPYQLEAVQENARKNGDDDDPNSPTKGNSSPKKSGNYSPNKSGNYLSSLTVKKESSLYVSAKMSSSKIRKDLAYKNKQKVEIEARRKLGEVVSNQTTT
jgi:hypothetical protein